MQQSNYLTKRKKTSMITHVDEAVHGKVLEVNLSIWFTHRIADEVQASF